MRAPYPLYKPADAPVLGDEETSDRFSLPEDEFDRSEVTERTTYDVPNVGPTARTSCYVPVQL